MLGYDRTYVEVDLDAIEENLSQVRKRSRKKILGVVKADAYGHGAVAVARRLKNQCDFFGVACMEEAIELRLGGIENPILLLGYTSPREFPLAVQYDLRVAIFREADGLALSRAARSQGKLVPFHFALDTGMSRIGFQPTRESVAACLRISRLPGIYAEGLFSHFATADEGDLTKSLAQAQRFRDFDQALREGGLDIPLRHLDNSAGVMNFGGEFEMVRSGIVTYGLYPSEEVDPATLPLKPALAWKSGVSHVKTLEPGREVSYGGTYRLETERRIATVPVGYADGYSRRLSGCFYVLISGKKAPILGRVCMDQFMVDVTDIPGVQVDTPVTLVGRDGEAFISVEEIAAAAGTINYEFICGIARRVPRIYRAGGKLVERADKLLNETTIAGGQP